MIMGMCIGCSPYNAEQSVITQAIAVLRRFGTDAHVYLPGVGMLNGLQAGNYLESTGVTPGAVDQPVGLVLDAAGGLGVELVTVPTVAAVPIGGPAFTSYAVGPATVAGKTYSVSFTVSDYNGTGTVSLDGGSSQWVVNPSVSGDTSLAGNGSKNFIIQCANPAAIRVFSRSTNTCTFSNISVREVTGIHAQQPTTSAKPILRRGSVCLNPYSGDLSNVAWARLAASIPPELFADPVGNVATRKLTESTENNFHQVSMNIALAAGTHTFAVVAKDAGRRYVTLTPVNSSAAYADSVNRAVSFDLLGGTVTQVFGSAVLGSVESIGNGFYLLTATVTTANAVASGGASLRLSAIPNPNSGAGYAGDGISGVLVHRAALFQGTYTAQQIQALGGIPLTTTAPASTALGPQYWSFDGSNDSLSLGGPLFQMADDHCVIAGGLSTLATGDRYFLDHGSSASAIPMVASLALAGTLAKVYWRDDANVTTAINGGFVAQGSVAILSARKVSTTGVLRVNGQQVASAAIAAGATTCTGAAIGTRVFPANMLAGQVYPVIAIKGTVSDSDLLLLEKWLGSMSGVTI